LNSDGIGNAENRTLFILDPNQNQIVLQFDDATPTNATEAANLSNRYLTGPGVDQHLADEQITSYPTAGTIFWPLADHLNTVRDVIDNLGANKVHRVYDAFGKMTETPTTETYLFAHTGRPLDKDTQLQNHWNRWYDTVIARWASKDPIGFGAGDANLYRYVGNLPSTRTDPFGLQEGTATDGLLDQLGVGERTRRLLRSESGRVRLALETLAECNCPTGSLEEFRDEARTIANAYVNAYYESTTWRIPRPYPWLSGELDHLRGDYRGGWMCYQWQVIMWRKLNPVVQGLKHFDIKGVGFVSGVTGSRKLGHNWIAISARSNAEGIERAKAGECTVYLDPWWDEGPNAYAFTGSGYERGHPTHNYLVDSFNPNPDGSFAEEPTGSTGNMTDGSGMFTTDEWKW